MHPCLQINEILTNIFESTRELEVRDYDHPRFPLWPAKGSRNLTALARACKTFSEPALDLLWEFQPSLAPLVRCFPRDVLAVKFRNIKFFAGHDELVITRDLLSKDWERVNYYARRIKAIGCCQQRHFRWSSLSFNALATIQSCKLTPGPILPNLLHFSACLSDFLDTPVYPSLVVGDRLKTVNVVALDSHQTKFIDNDLLAANLASIFGPISPSISSCSMLLPTGYAWGVFPSPILTQLYCGFTFMQTFDLQGAHTSCETLLTLSALPYLKNLKIVTSGTQMQKFNSVTRSDSIFSSLEELWIQTDALVHIQEFFEYFKIGTLRTFQVSEAFNHMYVWDIDSFVNTFQRKQGTPHLKDFGIFAQPYWGPPPTGTPQITNHTLTPLLSSANMMTLTVDIGVVMIDNEMLKKMGDAWPHLRSLDLSDRSTGTIPQVTLSGLIPLVSSCRDLRSLNIRLNVLNDGQPTLSMMEHLNPGNALELFNVCTSPVENIDAVVDTTQKLFPRLKVVLQGWIYLAPGTPIVVGREPVGIEDEYYQRWEKISEIFYNQAIVN